jgi:type I restriction enzyme M protein
MKKNKSDSKVLFIDATAEFVRGSAKNKLNDDHMKRILDCYASRSTEEFYSRLVDHKEIEAKDYNISVGTYVAPKDDRKIVNITELNKQIGEIVRRQNELRTQIDAIVADLEGDVA